MDISSAVDNGHTSVKEIAEMFPGIDHSIINKVFNDNKGVISSTVDELLAISAVNSSDNTNVSETITQQNLILNNSGLFQTAQPQLGLGSDLNLPASSPSCQPFSLQYTLISDNDRQHENFLNKFQDFNYLIKKKGCEQISLVDSARSIPFDLYRIYMEVCKFGGYHKMKTYQDWSYIVLQALKIHPDMAIIKNVRCHYKKYLFQFEQFYNGTLYWYPDQNSSHILPNTSTSLTNTSQSSATSSATHIYPSTSSGANGPYVPNSSTISGANGPYVTDYRSFVDHNNKRIKIRSSLPTTFSVPSISTAPNYATSISVPSVTLNYGYPTANYGPSQHPVQGINQYPQYSTGHSGMSQYLGLSGYPGSSGFSWLSQYPQYNTQYIGMPQPSSVLSTSNGTPSTPSGPVLRPFDSPPSQTTTPSRPSPVAVVVPYTPGSFNTPPSNAQDPLDDPQPSSANEDASSEQIAAEVQKAKKLAEEKLEASKAALAETSLLFTLSQLENSDPDFVRITDKCKIFFNLYANSTVEIKEILKVECPENRVKYWQKSVDLAVPALHTELYKASPMLERELTSLDEIYRILSKDNTDNGCIYELYKYAKPDTSGKCTMVVADVMMGSQIDSTDTHVSADGPQPYWVCYRNQIMLKYVVNVVATRIMTSSSSLYPGVPEILQSQYDGVLEVDIRSFDFRNASDPYVDIIMKATGLYDGGCLQRRNYFKQGAVKKKTIKQVGIVVCHSIWSKYNQRLQNLQEKGGKEIFAFHATPPTNVQSIAQNNLDWRRSAAHGRALGDGCYFSEFPEFSARYNNQCMFIFKLILLPGHFHRHKPTQGGYCEQIIITDNTLFKPVYVLYF